MITPKVWVIDDDKAMRCVLERAFQKAQIPVMTFESAITAMHELETTTPTAILTDVRMPGMDGFEFLDRIKTDHPALPIIIMTAHSDLESAVSAFHGGAFEYLPKPFDIKEMIAVVERACIHSQQTKHKTLNQSAESEETRPTRTRAGSLRVQKEGAADS